MCNTAIRSGRIVCPVSFCVHCCAHSHVRLFQIKYLDWHVCASSGHNRHPSIDVAASFAVFAHTFCAFDFAYRWIQYNILTLCTRIHWMYGIDCARITHYPTPPDKFNKRERNNALSDVPNNAKQYTNMKFNSTKLYTFFHSHFFLRRIERLGVCLLGRIEFFVGQPNNRMEYMVSRRAVRIASTYRRTQAQKSKWDTRIRYPVNYASACMEPKDNMCRWKANTLDAIDILNEICIEFQSKAHTHDKKKKNQALTRWWQSWTAIFNTHELKRIGNESECE